jgi:hypothetical protein
MMTTIKVRLARLEAKAPQLVRAARIVFGDDTQTVAPDDPSVIRVQFVTAVPPQDRAETNVSRMNRGDTERARRD